MSLALKTRPPLAERALGIAFVVGLHALAALGLLAMAQPMLKTLLAEPVRIELIPPPPATKPTPPEAPKPLPMQAKPLSMKLRAQVPTPKPNPAPAPLIQSIASAESAQLVASSAPARETPAPIVEARSANAQNAQTASVEAAQAPRFDADYLHNPAPAYPRASRSQREQGHVLLRVQVSEDGRALQVLIDTGSGFQRLDQAAREAVANWRFVPARQGQQAIAGWVKVPIVFSLNN